MARHASSIPNVASSRKPAPEYRLLPLRQAPSSQVPLDTPSVWNGGQTACDPFDLLRDKQLRDFDWPLSSDLSVEASPPRRCGGLRTVGSPWPSILRST